MRRGPCRENDDNPRRRRRRGRKRRPDNFTPAAAATLRTARGRSIFRRSPNALRRLGAIKRHQHKIGNAGGGRSIIYPRTTTSSSTTDDRAHRSPPDTFVSLVHTLAATSFPRSPVARPPQNKTKSARSVPIHSVCSPRDTPFTVRSPARDHDKHRPGICHAGKQRSKKISPTYRPSPAVFSFSSAHFLSSPSPGKANLFSSILTSPPPPPPPPIDRPARGIGPRQLLQQRQAPPPY